MLIPDEYPMVSLLGSRDELLRVIEGAFRADIHVRGNEITVTGSPDESGTVVRLFEELVEVLRSGGELTPDAVERSIAMLRMTSDRPAEVLSLDILSSRGRTIRPKTVNQKRYVDAIDKHTIVFGIGPAGTGKTYLAMAKAVRALQEKRVNRIILTRPAVEAGERLGFLPGTLYEKIDPYLRPLYDALHDMIDPDSIPKLMAAGTIEVAPLAYMRGRALPMGTGVLTPDGFRSIGELEVGDLVIGSNGEPTPVLGVYPQGEKKIYRLFSQDGASVLASEDHLWAVRTRDDANRGKPWRVLETKEMIGDLRTAHYRKWQLPLLSAPVCFPEREVPMDPYALGLLLGDGCVTGTTTPSFATNDPELAEALEHALPGVRARWRSGPNYVLNRVRKPGDTVTIANPVTDVMRRLGLSGRGSHTKFVPEVYLRNTSEIRIAVLQGLLDADGGPVTQQGRTCRIQFTTVSPRLRDDVVFLVQSLGGVAYAHERPAAGRRPGLAKGRPVRHRHDAYTLDIRLPEGIQPFRLSRKAEIYKTYGGGRPVRFVDRIEPRGTAECVCIQVAAEDSLYVTEDFLLTHNTLNDAFIILDEAQNSSAEQMKMFLTRLGFNSKIVVTGDVTQVDLPAGTLSGLRVVQEILDGIPDIHFARLSSADVVRHKLVSDIVDAYGRYDALQEPKRLQQQRGKRRVSEHEH
ncbi:phosphate starvation-inducible protein PhoH [Nonomuraea jiangxiensis]|uniref:PhoH-like protein n=1 Tax=Nonomuraea jiangxiensis TaxID=633440 RepID=A0A1G7YHM6_9ACTN|nr:phosphate starvation-inducible protein PhoH [Nonomuraea jiangxiensis]